MFKISHLLCAAALAASAHAGIITYDIPAGTAGTQNFGNSLGMDFNINDRSGVTITDIGAFDASSDGISGPLSVAIYDRTTQTIVPGTSTTLNGLDGTAVGGHRFANLANPVHLPAGFRGSIVASGYNAAELNGNGVLGQTTAGGGSIAFVGGSRFGADTGFPASVDGGPANRYLAGSFIFDVIPDTPGTTQAISVPNGTAGNQNFGGPLGIDFVVTTPVSISSLGAFDSGSDGIAAGTTLTTELWSRSGDTGVAILGSQTFTDGNPGLLSDGYRHQDLGAPILLAPGEYSIVAHGFNDNDMNGNGGIGGALPEWDNQNLAIDFIGSSRFGDAGTEGTFPDQIDGSPAQYLAGTFTYTVIPEPGTAALLVLAAAAAIGRRRRQ